MTKIFHFCGLIEIENLLMFAVAAKNDVPVKKEMPSPVKTCSFDEQIKGSFPFVNYSTYAHVNAVYLLIYCT